jgi:dipeptidyl aminopeptidase/acylaminoacyl peptidase
MRQALGEGLQSGYRFVPVRTAEHNMSMPAVLVALVALAVASTTLSAADAATAKGLTADDLVRLARVSDPQVSPDGRRVAYTLRETDLEANRGRTDLWVLELGKRPRDGASSPPRRLTQHPASDSAPRWAPDGRGLYFLSSRGGSSQIWYLALAGGEPQQVTTLPLDVGSFEVSPRGDRLAVSMEVFADCVDLQCSVDRLAARDKNKASGLIYDQLFVRHWDTWKDGRLSQLFTLPLAADGKAGKPVNVSRAVRADVPSKPFGGDEDYAFSRDGARIVFSARLSDRSEPWSTNFDLYEVAADGSDAPRNLTADNPAWDAQPVFLANGDLAWLAMARPGFEADRFKVMLRSARDGKVRPLTGDWDRSVGHLGASFDGKRLLATADDIGQVALFEIDPATGVRSRLVGEGQVQAFAPAAQGIVIAWASLGSPQKLAGHTRLFNSKTALGPPRIAPKLAGHT